VRVLYLSVGIAAALGRQLAASGPGCPPNPDCSCPCASSAGQLSCSLCRTCSAPSTRRTSLGTLAAFTVVMIGARVPQPVVDGDSQVFECRAVPDLSRFRPLRSSNASNRSNDESRSARS
jgi:hypothetical protein